MKVVRKSIRYLFRTMTGVIAFILIYLLLAWLMPYWKLNASYVNAAENEGVEIFVLSNGVHTDLVLPLKNRQADWEKLFPYSDFEDVYDGFNYIAIGWGDKGFFLNTPTWADLKFSTAFNAAFALSSTAMHVTYKYKKPETGLLCKRLVLSKEQYENIKRYILMSFRWKNKMPVHIDHKGYTSQDTFYEAKGTYSLFKTCNVWTGNALVAAGVRIGVWTPFDKGIIDHLE
ncbi:MAG: TIGR02117 family protein [Bacteroidia bacterium]